MLTSPFSQDIGNAKGKTACLLPYPVASQGSQHCPTREAGEAHRNVCGARRLGSFPPGGALQKVLGFRPAACHRRGWEKVKNGNVGYHILTRQLDLAEQCGREGGAPLLLWGMFGKDRCGR